MIHRITIVKHGTTGRGGVPYFDVTIAEQDRRASYKIIAKDRAQATAHAHRIFDGHAIEPKTFNRIMEAA